MTATGDLPGRAPLPEDGYRISQNYPNPFNPSTRIQFHVAEAALVSLKVFDVTGREIATLVNGFRQAGLHEVTFDASSLASGPYLSRMEAAGHVATGRVLLLK